MSVQVAVLRVAAVAEIGPETVEGLLIWREELTFAFETRIC